MSQVGNALTTAECYISVDIEASGPVPALYSMLSIGACVVGTPHKTFYAELQPITDRAVPAALQVSGLSLERLAETGREPAEVMRAFGEWIVTTATGRSPVFVGFNASFDWAFVNWYFHHYLGGNPFGIGALDIKAYYMGLMRCHWADTASSHLPAAYRLEPAQAHHALADAIAQAALFEKLLGA